MFFIVHYMVGWAIPMATTRCETDLTSPRSLVIIFLSFKLHNCHSLCECIRFDSSSRQPMPNYTCASSNLLSLSANEREKNIKCMNDLQWCQPSTDYRLPTQIVGHERNVIDHHNFRCGFGVSLHMSLNRRCAVCAADAHIERNNTHLV